MQLRVNLPYHLDINNNFLAVVDDFVNELKGIILVQGPEFREAYPEGVNDLALLYGAAIFILDWIDENKALPQELTQQYFGYLVDSGQFINSVEGVKGTQERELMRPREDQKRTLNLPRTVGKTAQISNMFAKMGGKSGW